ncbi:MAG: RNA polymerase sigma factor RpoD/SigA [Treponema sp.]|jgi:RNA polymerase primary sigma factor|nr:RNA polymerase sigma factor RpoD/SigA [Treponema sp.]
MKNETNRKEKAENNLALYFKEISRIPLLTREEEKTTAIAAAAGSQIAREKLVNANLRFVVNIAKKYQGLGLSLEDLISEGNVGLLIAVDRFDVKKGYHFISYAVWWIRQSIMNALCEKARMIRLPSNRAAEIVKIEKARKIIERECSSEEVNAEIAELLNMDKTTVADLVNISREILSLDTPVSSDKDFMLKDLIEDKRYNSPEKETEQKLLMADLEDVLDSLRKDEADILRCHYGLGQQALSLKEIGAKYNLSKERIRQIEAKALARLKNPLRMKILQPYVA